MAEEQVADVSQGEVAPSVIPAGDATDTAGNWRESLPEEIRDHKSLDSIRDVGGLAKGYLHAQSMVGADKVPIPGQWATSDDWNMVYDKLGRPADADGYELEMGEGVEADAGMVEWFKKTSHDVGLSGPQAQKLMAAYNAMQGGRTQMATDAVAQTRSNAELELKREWGQAYDQRIGYATAVLQNFDAEDMAELRMSDGSLMGDNPAVVKLMSKVGQFIAEKTGEDSFAGSKGSGVMAPDEAHSKLREITSKESPYWSARHPEHDWYVAEAMRLREFTTAGQP
jgi:hypothetical protein